MYTYILQFKPIIRKIMVYHPDTKEMYFYSVLIEQQLTGFLAFCMTLVHSIQLYGLL